MMVPHAIIAAFVGAAALMILMVINASRGARRALDSAAFTASGMPGTPFTLVLPGGTGRTHDVFLRWAASWSGDANGDRLALDVIVTVGGEVTHRASFLVGDDVYGTPLPVGAVRGLDASVTSGATSGRIRQADAIVRVGPTPSGVDARVTVTAEPRPSATIERLQLVALT